MRKSRALPSGTAAGLAMALVAACGPSVDLATGVRSQATNVLLGAPIVHALGSHDAPVPSFPGVAPVGPAVSVPKPPVVVPLPAPKACPAADPTAFPPQAVTQRLTRPPKPGRYSYREHGVAKADGKTVAALPRKAVWRVRSIKPPLPAESYAFSITAPTFRGGVTTTDYAVMKPVVNVSQTIPPTNIGLQPIGGGIYVTRIETRSHGTTTTFAPLAPGVELIGQPMVNGATWNGIGVDVTHSLTMSVSGQIVGDQHVNACGKQLDAWRVKVTTTVFGLSENLTQTERYDVGSEYGGLLLSVQRSITGSAGGQDVDQQMTATIDSIKPVQAPAANRTSRR
ncbi:MAG TPA: hypothetical protein VHC43_06835 [Mycobacteriales bacterium]|nr:hypothetical protein [Mycobacteriales bacterium]